MYRQRVDLTERIAAQHASDFASFGQVPVVVSLLSLDPRAGLLPGTDVRLESMTARVRRGVLRLELRTFVRAGVDLAAPAVERPRLAWLVDTRANENTSEVSSDGAP
jgi:hypothetical protein